MKRLILAITVIILFSSVYAQEISVQSKITENAKQNLLMGIQSDNNGLVRSCIYLAGKYNIVELVPVLIEKAKTEKSRNNRILIALSLSKMNTSEALDAVYELAMNDNDNKVRRVCGAIFQQFLKDNSMKLVSQDDKD